MNKERLKTEIELFKMYAFFVIAIATGVSSILVNESYKIIYINWLLIASIILLILFSTLLLISYYKLKKK